MEDLDCCLQLPDQAIIPKIFSLHILYLVVFWKSKYLLYVFFSRLCSSLHFGDPGPEVILSLTTLNFLSPTYLKLVSTRSLCFSHPNSMVSDFENLFWFIFSIWVAIDEMSEKKQEVIPLTTVSVKLPSFWTNSQEVWSIQAEAQFENKRITFSCTKFTHCVDLDLVREPPTKPYEALWRRLIQMYSLQDLQSLPL